jgi:maleylacetoacetate isomerase
MYTLYSYFRSSATYRVRIALNLKGLVHATVPIHLLENGGAQHSPAYIGINPSQLVPTLVDGELNLGQSMAIMEYLDETQPTTPLLPTDAVGRARVRALAQLVACEIHPLNNLRVLQYLETELKLDKAAQTSWYQHWVETGFTAMEQMLSRSEDTGDFCHGNTPGMADCCLVPQLYNARRYKVALQTFPTLLRIEANCLQLDAFVQAAPENQADAPQPGA